MCRSILEHLSENIRHPVVLVESNQFIVKLAETKAEFAEALLLRYQRFYCDQAKLIPIGSSTYSADLDRFDEHCVHLLCLDKESRNLVGTCRVLLGPIAIKTLGFYSEEECFIKGLKIIADKTAEMGRICIANNYRNGLIVGFLWKAFFKLMKRAHLRYAIGCLSLWRQKPEIAWGLYYYFEKKNCISKLLQAFPNKGFQLEKPKLKMIEKNINDEKALTLLIPPMLKVLLHMGTQICGEPINDKNFGTIDFFILLDIEKMPSRYLKYYEI